jgi:hypothetical protein
MTELNAASTWLKLAMFTITLAFSMHLFSMDGDGFGTASYGSACGQWYASQSSGQPPKGCNLNAHRAVQALEIIGFISTLTAMFLVLCLVLVDELKGNKIAQICVIVTSLLGGLLIIIGIAVFEGSIEAAPFSSAVGVMAGISALLAAVFSILDLVGINAPPVKG